MIEKFDIDIAYHGDGGLATDLGSIIEQAKDIAFCAFEILDSLSPKSGRLGTSPKGRDALWGLTRSRRRIGGAEEWNIGHVKTQSRADAFSVSPALYYLRVGRKQSCGCFDF